MTDTDSILRQRIPDDTTRDDISDDKVIHNGADEKVIEAPTKSSRCFPLKFLLGIVVFIVCSIVIIDCLVPSDVDAEPFTLPAPPSLEGALEPNTLLTKGERLFENEIVGPESIVVKDGHIYTGTGDGKVIDIYKGTMKILATFGKPPCGGFDDEPTCGRPLGMRFDKNGFLVVMDAYLGIFKVNVATGEFETLYSSAVPIEGIQAKFLNDLDIASDGKIYFTDSSYKWQRRFNRIEVIEAQPYGRLMVYDPTSGLIKVLYKGLYFGNGVQLSHDESHVIVSETSRARLLKYNLMGDQANTMEIFSDNLPGFPDNVRKSHSGGYWVGISVVRHSAKFNIIDFLAPHAWLRRFISKIIPQELIVKSAGKPYGLIIELGKSGEILRSLHDPSGTFVPSISEVEDDSGTLYLGSYNLPYLTRIRNV